MQMGCAIGYAEAWSGMLVFDTLVFGLTVRRSMELHKITGSSILTLILRDGESQLIYCMVIRGKLMVTGSVYFGLETRTSKENVILTDGLQRHDCHEPCKYSDVGGQLFIHLLVHDLEFLSTCLRSAAGWVPHT
jgi:hypothetical protein